MVRLGLGAANSVQGKFTVCARLPAELYASVRLDMARSGMSVKQQSEWFCLAVNYLHGLAAGDNDGFIGGYKMLSGGTGRPRQIYLTESAAEKFLEMEDILRGTLGPRAKVRTKLIILATSTYLATNFLQ